MRASIIFPVALMGVLVVVGVYNWLPSTPPSKVYDLAAGRAIYMAHCASCHGEDLSGEPDWKIRKPNGRLPAPPHDATGHTWHHADSLLFELTKYGPAALIKGEYASDMPAYRDVLSDEQIVSALEYIKSTWPEKVRREQERRTKAARP